jgi:hypothetical protein
MPAREVNLKKRIRNRLAAASGLVPMALLWLAPAAAAPQTAAAPKRVATPAPVPPLEPAALEKLKAMSDLLKSTPRLTFTAQSDREQPSLGGQMLDFFGVGHISVSRPNRVRIDTKGDLHDASLWYDGKTVTIYSVKSSFYGQAAAPPTIDETVHLLMDRFQTPLPAAAFLLADPYAKMMEGVKTAFDAGEAEVDGAKCRHLAFSEEDADWQVWIEEGAKPLPRRLAVTYKKVQGAPRIVTTLSDWNLSPALAAGEFDFVPPAGATKVQWKEVPK